jgi:hypothetical protein
MQGGMVANRLQHDMNPRDAVVSFQCVPSDLVRVTETVDGESIHYREIPRNPGVVGELEERYMFFANQAELARRRLRLGQSCVFSVYFREP